MKLLLFLGLIVGSIGLSFLLSDTTHAAGETYRWIDASTIRGSGGAYSTNIRNGNDTSAGTVTFKRDGNSGTYRAVGDYFGRKGSISPTTGTAPSCDLQLALLMTGNGRTATVRQNNPGADQCNDTGLSKTRPVANAAGNAPNNLPANPADGAGNNEEDPGEATNCKVDGIGWIICPLAGVMAKVVDGAYAFVSSLLKVQPLVVEPGGPSDSIYGAWTVMRNFANIAFVIAFLIIIFSQLTSVGLNNYGIKKMLPRLIVAAILVNVSFWICAIAVDISNILGASLNNLFQGIPIQGTTDTVEAQDIGSTWSDITVLVLAGTGIAIFAFYAVLSALLPALLIAAVAIFTVFAVLTLRQALIVLLIVISPLAFVAYLLPNTESLFKKWKGLFQTLLLMYPIIALIFGASALASKIVMNTATGDYAVAIQIMGAMVAIIPLALTPMIMKTAGGLLNRFGGFINNPNKGPVDKLRKGAESLRDSRQDLARGRRLNGVGKNRLTRAFRRKAAEPTKARLNMQQRREKNKATAESAESGYLMENQDAIDAGRLRMAKSAADSARQTGSLKGLDSDTQLAALGQQGSTNQSLVSALDSQEKQAERQAVQETQGFHGKDSVDQLKENFQAALNSGDTVGIQAYIGLLDERGPKGVQITEEVIKKSDERTDEDKASTNWDVARTEFSRSVGKMMGQSEIIKQFSVSTEIGSDNKLTTGDGKNISYQEAYSKATGVGSGAGDKLDKLKNQHDGIQTALIENDAVPVEVMRAALDPVNRGSFKSKDLEVMEAKVAHADALNGQGGGSTANNGTVPPQQASNPDGEIKIEHNDRPQPQAQPQSQPQQPQPTAPQQQYQQPQQPQQSTQPFPATTTSNPNGESAFSGEDRKLMRELINKAGAQQQPQYQQPPQNPATTRTSQPPGSTRQQYDPNTGLYTNPKDRP
ncbi:MAG TPA: hypothetical protein VFM68_00920 [Candidatus Saccharimonadales bacterium]|nr:hypothetical protein [Candidatus Saccharimonadales bacterium]